MQKRAKNSKLHKRKTFLECHTLLHFKIVKRPNFRAQIMACASYLLFPKQSTLNKRPHFPIPIPFLLPLSHPSYAKVFLTALENEVSACVWLAAFCLYYSQFNLSITKSTTYMRVLIEIPHLKEGLVKYPAIETISISLKDQIQHHSIETWRWLLCK